MGRKQYSGGVIFFIFCGQKLVENFFSHFGYHNRGEGGGGTRMQCHHCSQLTHPSGVSKLVKSCEKL